MDNQNLLPPPPDRLPGDIDGQAHNVVYTTAERLHGGRAVARHPTAEAYAPLVLAFDFFNDKLFEGKLPRCIITLQRNEERVLGYYHHDRFGHREQSNVTVDEIALNPRHFKTRRIEETLSTLVHEMVHLWQHHDPEGKPSRVGYHNKFWAVKMEHVGLQLTHNGQPDGRKHGQHMTHIIVQDGPFDRACKELISDEFRLAWYDRLTEMTRVKGSDSDGNGGRSLRGSNAGKREKFTCPACADNAWGKATLKLICGTCNQPMTA